MADDGLQPMRETERGLAGGLASIVVAGIVLGVSYNWFGLRAARPWGLPWVSHDVVAEFASLEPLDLPAAADPHYTPNSDPFAMEDTPSDGVTLPEIPEVGRPVPVALRVFELYVGAGAAMILDAREPQEFAEGHVPGAVNLTYEQAATDPAVLESLDARGRPIITYCGGGGCEVSLKLAHELIASGFPRVAVYTGGYPEWEAANKPVVTGAGAP